MQRLGKLHLVGRILHLQRERQAAHLLHHCLRFGDVIGGIVGHLVLVRPRRRRKRRLYRGVEIVIQPLVQHREVGGIADGAPWLDLVERRMLDVEHDEDRAQARNRLDVHRVVVLRLLHLAEAGVLVALDRTGLQAAIACLRIRNGPERHLVEIWTLLVPIAVEAFERDIVARLLTDVTERTRADRVVGIILPIFGDRGRGGDQAAEHARERIGQR